MAFPRERRKTSGLRARAWWILRKNKEMTLPDIMRSVCTGVEKNAETNLRTWFNHLIKAGILGRERINDGKVNSNGTYLYRLLIDLGAECPVVQLEHSRVYDPNARKIYTLDTGGSYA